MSIHRAEREGVCKLQPIRRSTMAPYVHPRVRKLKDISPVTPHFLSRVSYNTLLDYKLRIPKEFMKKYGKTLSNPVGIKVPNGTKWKIWLTKYDGDVWSAKGWLEFAHYFSLENGQTLIFSYKGCSQFDVVIIGTNGLEIDYPLIISNFNSTPIKETDIDDASSCAKANEKSPPPFPCAQKRMKRNLSAAPTQCGSLEINQENPMNRGNLPHSCESKEIEVESHRAKPQVRAVPKQRPLNKAEKDKALSRTKDFTSQYPHFKVVMQRGHLHNRYEFVFPIDFWFQHLYKVVGAATLCVSDGRTWTVELYGRLIGLSDRKIYFLRTGWREFVEDNDPKIGDVCIFELTNKNEKEISFKVAIDRGGDYQNSQPSQADKNTANQDQREKSPSAISKTASPSHKDEPCNMQSPVDHIAEEGAALLRGNRC